MTPIETVDLQLLNRTDAQCMAEQPHFFHNGVLSGLNGPNERLSSANFGAYSVDGRGGIRHVWSFDPQRLMVEQAVTVLTQFNYKVLQFLARRFFHRRQGSVKSEHATSRLWPQIAPVLAAVGSGKIPVKNKVPRAEVGGGNNLIVAPHWQRVSWPALLLLLFFP